MTRKLNTLFKIYTGTYNHQEGRELTYLKYGNDRRRVDKDSRLDKFIVTEDLLIKEVTYFM